MTDSELRDSGKADVTGSVAATLRRRPPEQHHELVRLPKAHLRTAMKVQAE